MLVPTSNGGVWDGNLFYWDAGTETRFFDNFCGGLVCEIYRIGALYEKNFLIFYTKSRFSFLDIAGQE